MANFTVSEFFVKVIDLGMEQLAMHDVPFKLLPLLFRGGVQNELIVISIVYSLTAMSLTTLVVFRLNKSEAIKALINGPLTASLYYLRGPAGPPGAPGRKGEKGTGGKSALLLYCKKVVGILKLYNIHIVYCIYLSSFLF